MPVSPRARPRETHIRPGVFTLPWREKRLTFLISMGVATFSTATGRDRLTERTLRPIAAQPDWQVQRPT